MGKTFGALALVFGLIALLMGWAIMLFVADFGSYIMYALCGLAIVLGIIGIITDDSKGMAIAGIILGLIALVIWPLLWTILFLVLFAAIFGGLF